MSSGDEDTAVSDVAQAIPVARASTDCLVVVYQRDGGAGRSIKLDHLPLRIGRDPSNELVLDDDGVSRRHARIERRSDRLVVMDVGSTNGTLLNDAELSGIVELRTGDRLQVGPTIFKYLSATDLEAALHEQIFSNATTDALTGLRSKRHLTDELGREFSRARRYNRAFSLLMIDIDHFKAVNDDYGHQVGDITLRAVAGNVLSCLPTDSFAARYGGEEFVVLLLETKLEDAVAIAERIRLAIAELTVSYRDVSLQVTVSVGCAEYSHADDSELRLFERADQRMYAAKQAGRNTVAY
ncbi:MAG TPA: GGDEF domain-containing protein [Polyangiaceae bacterium]|nr:GGDEF domain-containing protein [Polyangiaceae bacterium]